MKPSLTPAKCLSADSSLGLLQECWYWPFTQNLQKSANCWRGLTAREYSLLRIANQDSVVRWGHPLVIALFCIKGLDRRQLMYTCVFWQVEEGLVSRSDAEECVTSEFNPVRAGFYGGDDVWTRDVLNLGVRPDKIIEKVSQMQGMSSDCYRRWAIGRQVDTAFWKAACRFALDWLVKVWQHP